MRLDEAKRLLKKAGYKLKENELPGQEYVKIIKKIYPDAEFKIYSPTEWRCLPEKADPVIEWEESTAGFWYEDGKFSVWMPDWEHLEDEDYWGGEWQNLDIPESIPEYIKQIHKEAEEYKESL